MQAGKSSSPNLLTRPTPVQTGLSRIPAPTNYLMSRSRDAVHVGLGPGDECTMEIRRPVRSMLTGLVSGETN